MKMKKSVYTVLRFSLLVIGFALVCLGAFYVSSSYVCNCTSEMIVAYSLLPLGFCLLLVGIFWSTYHEANHKNLFYNMIRRMHHSRDVHVETVDRPDFYPPSYESVIQEINLNSTNVRAIEESLNIPPPLYTESTLDVVDETFTSTENPPSYDALMQQDNTVTLSRPKEAVAIVSGTNTETYD